MDFGVVHFRILKLSIKSVVAQESTGLTGLRFEVD